MARGDGLDALSRNYDEAGLTQTMIDLGEAAERAARLAIVSGHAIFAAGGSMTEQGKYVATPRARVAEEIAEYSELTASPSESHDGAAS